MLMIEMNVDSVIALMLCLTIACGITNARSLASSTISGAGINGAIGSGIERSVIALRWVLLWSSREGLGGI
jgi:hypothetical protein